jgi:hypothetical protein
MDQYPQSDRVPPGWDQVPPPTAPGYDPGYGYGYGYGYPAPLVQPSNGMGIAGLVLGIVSVFMIGFPVTNILAIVFGAQGRAKARRGEATNGGQALAGIILGVVGLALFALIIILVLYAASQVGSESGGTVVVTP